MTTGKGYAAEGIEGTTGAHEVSFRGKPNSGTINSEVLYFSNDEQDFNDYNLIGNPYPAAIDMEAFLSLNTDINAVIDGTVYFWTHATPLEGGTYGDDYITYNFTGVVPVSNDVHNNIASGQGFFVRALRSDRVTFEPGMVLEGSNDQFFKGNDQKQYEEKDRVWISLKASDQTFKQILIGFDERATEGMDPGFDARYLSGSQSVEFYSLLSGKRVSIQGLGALTDKTAIDLGFETQNEGLTLTLELSRLEGELKTREILLLDRENGEIHDLKRSPYSFVYQGKGIVDDRFQILFEGTLLGIDEEHVENSTALYIRNDFLVVDAPEVVDKVNIYDTLGRRILTNRPHSEQFELNLEAIDDGNLIIVELIDVRGGSTSRKMLKF
jgi:hypothetical protein